MLNHSLYDVLDAVQDLPTGQRPKMTQRLLVLMLREIEWNTGRVMVGSADLAARLGCTKSNLSTMLKTLRDLKVLRSEWQRIEHPDAFGAKRKVFYVNPEMIWEGSLEARAEVAASPEWQAINAPDAALDRPEWLETEARHAAG